MGFWRWGGEEGSNGVGGGFNPKVLFEIGRLITPEELSLAKSPDGKEGGEVGVRLQNCLSFRICFLLKVCIPRQQEKK